MPIAILDSDSAHGRRLGVSFRRRRPGPELDLIESFLRAMPLHIPRGCRATVFREPQLESGFPDLVIVVWRVAMTREWRPARIALKPQDLRVMHYLHRTRRANFRDLRQCFPRTTTASLERLQEAKMIRRVGESWASYALSRSFAATKIIAVEAKVGKWAAALDQAVLNTWFASTSYILIPNSPSGHILDVAQRLGIGVCSLDDGDVREVDAVSCGLPRSYASWILNDWAWRASLL